MKDKVLAELKQMFRPEFLNRIDARSSSTRCAGADSRDRRPELQARRTQLTEQEITLEVTMRRRTCWRAGYDHAYGARPLRRMIQNLIEDPLAEGCSTAASSPTRPFWSRWRTTCLKLSPSPYDRGRRVRHRRLISRSAIQSTARSSGTANTVPGFFGDAFAKKNACSILDAKLVICSLRSGGRACFPLDASVVVKHVHAHW